MRCICTTGMAPLSLLLLLLPALAAAPFTAAEWQAFLGRSDPLYTWSDGDALAPVKWFDSGFVGNGALGMMVRGVPSVDDTLSGLRFDVGRTDIYDDRQSTTNASKPPGSAGRSNFACDAPRLPIGAFLANFELRGAVQQLSALEMRIDLFNGQVRGKVTPVGGGSCSFSLWSHAVYSQADVSALQFNCTPGLRAAVECWAEFFIYLEIQCHNIICAATF